MNKTIFATLTTILSCVSILVGVTTFFSTYLSTRIKRSSMSWTIRGWCVAIFIEEAVRLLNFHLQDVFKNSPVCEISAIILNGTTVWRQFCFILYLIQLIASSKASVPTSSSSGLNWKKGTLFVVNVLLPILSFGVFIGSHLISSMFQYKLFQYREKYGRCDFEESINFFVVVIPGILMLFGDIVAMSSALFLKLQAKEKQCSFVFMFCYPMLWILSWIVAIVGLYRSFLHLEFEVFDYIYLFMGPRFQHITFGLTIGIVVQHGNQYKYTLLSIEALRTILCSCSKQESESEENQSLLTVAASRSVPSVSHKRNHVSEPPSAPAVRTPLLEVDENTTAITRSSVRTKPKKVMLRTL